MKAKVPKRNFEINQNKQPRSSVDFSTNNFPISWQTNLIDFDSEWGLPCLKLLNLKIDDNKILEVSETNEDLVNALLQLNGKDFDSIDSFLNRLAIISKQTVQANQQKEILKYLQQKIFWDDILPKLKDFEGKHWSEIDRETFGKNSKSKHHFVKVSDLIKDAQKRLADLNLDDNDELYSMRLTGKIRIWGIRESGYLKIIWFDLQHAICPSSKD